MLRRSTISLDEWLRSSKLQFPFLLQTLRNRLCPFPTSHLVVASKSGIFELVLITLVNWKFAPASKGIGHISSHKTVAVFFSKTRFFGAAPSRFWVNCGPPRWSFIFLQKDESTRCRRHFHLLWSPWGAGIRWIFDGQQGQQQGGWIWVGTENDSHECEGSNAMYIVLWLIIICCIGWGWQVFLKNREIIENEVGVMQSLDDPSIVHLHEGASLDHHHHFFSLHILTLFNTLL